MGLLTSAIRAELDIDYLSAIRYYRKLAAHGSLLDRVGIYQALARCHAKLGQLKKGAEWHEKAGKSYLRVTNRVMGESERAYYALLEFRSALQDYGSGKRMRRAGALYLEALAKCMKHGQEGYSHEMIFAGFLSAKLGDHQQAARFFLDASKQLRGTSLSRELHQLATLHLRTGTRR